MKILVLNCGSSSIKYALYDMDTKTVMTSGGAERVGLDGAFVKVKLANGEKRKVMHDIPEHTEGVKFKGVYNIYENKLDLFTPDKQRVTEKVEVDINSEELDKHVGEQDAGHMYIEKADSQSALLRQYLIFTKRRLS